MKDLSVSFLTTGLIQVLNIATGLLAARLLLPEGRGELAALLLWPGLIAELGNLGLLDALLYRAATRGASPRALFAATMALVAILSVALIGVGLIVLPLVFANHSPELQSLAVYFLIAYLPTYFASLFTSGMFQGQLHMTTWNMLRLLVPATYLVVILALLVLAGPSVANFAAAYIAAQITAAAVGLVLLARRGWVAWRPERVVMKGLVVYGAKVHVGEILHSLRQRIDQAVISLWLPAADLGLYVVALTVANGPLILVYTVANVAFPKISQQDTEGGKRVVFGRYLRFSLAAAAALVVALWLVVPWLLPLLFGRAFQPSVPIANVLLVGTLPLAAKLMFQQALKAWDRALVVGRAELIGLAAAAASIAVLMPAFGLIGVAWGIVLSQAAAAGAMAAALARDLRLPLLTLMIPTADDAAMVRQWFDKAARRLGLGHG